MNLQPKFNVAYIKLLTKTEGPFNRCCIWFQGCNLHCKGCCNVELQGLKPNHILSLDELVDIVKEAKEKYDIEGITLSGGEPTLQLHLKDFNEKIHDMGLGIIMFSGKPKSMINPDLVATVDLLIDGPFIEKQKDNERILIGSKNKKLSFITNRYKSYVDYFYCKNSIEEVAVEDYIFINGD